MKKTKRSVVELETSVRVERVARSGGKIGLGAAKLCEKRAAAPADALIFASRWEIINVDAASETAVPR